MVEQTVAGNMQAAIIPSDLVGKAVWEHVAPISAENVMDEKTQTAAPSPA